MSIWFLFAISAAVWHSLSNAFSKYLVLKLPKTVVAFYTWFFCSIILFSVSFYKGLPLIGDKFLTAILITGIINIITWIMILRAYQLTDFSSVFSMFLLSPIFLVATSFFILGEKPSLLGFLGIILILIGVFIIIKDRNFAFSYNKTRHRKGIILGLFSAFLFSISVNFDKIAVLNSDAIFTGAFVSAFIALGIVPFMIYFNRDLGYKVLTDKKYILLFFLVGLTIALTVISHNLALSVGLASYTIAVKRSAVIFGVLWGALFFKEKGLSRKIQGAIIAVLGIVTILLS